MLAGWIPLCLCLLSPPPLLVFLVGCYPSPSSCFLFLIFLFLFQLLYAGVRVSKTGLLPVNGSQGVENRWKTPVVFPSLEINNKTVQSRRNRRTKKEKENKLRWSVGPKEKKINGRTVGRSFRQRNDLSRIRCDAMRCDGMGWNVSSLGRQSTDSLLKKWHPFSGRCFRLAFSTDRGKHSSDLRACLIISSFHSVRRL